MSIGKMIEQNVLCTLCGAKYGQCDCWQKCSCGRSFEKGTQCNNPIHPENKDKKPMMQAIATGKLKI